MNTNTKSKTLADYTREVQAAKNEPVAELEALKGFQTDCERRIALPMGSDAADRIRARIELEETQKAIAEFGEWAIEHRQRFAAEIYLKAHATEICALLREEIDLRSKPLPGVIQSALQKAASITLSIFASKTDRHKIYKEREAAEQLAEDAEFLVDSARQAVRNFEIAQDEASFGAAVARTREINFPLVTTGS